MGRTKGSKNKPKVPGQEQERKSRGPLSERTKKVLDKIRKFTETADKQLRRYGADGADGVVLIEEIAKSVSALTGFVADLPDNPTKAVRVRRGIEEGAFVAFKDKYLEIYTPILGDSDNVCEVKRVLGSMVQVDVNGQLTLVPASHVEPVDVEEAAEDDGEDDSEDNEDGEDAAK